MRIISLCVDGIRQAAKRGLFDWLASQDADIICLQDLQSQEAELEGNPEFELEGYSGYFFGSGSPRHNGVAIYTRRIPKALMYGFGFASGEDMDGRYLQADFEHISIGSLLMPAGKTGTPSQDVKRKFLEDLQAHLQKVTHKHRSYIICGNWNIASSDLDVERPEALREESGFLVSEQQWINSLFKDIGYTDAFRRANTDGDEYSWWPSGEMGRGNGWRVDYQVISQSLAPKVEYAVMYKSKAFSSHLPVIVDYELEEL